MPIASNPDVSARPETTVEAIPAVLNALSIIRLLGVSRPTAYEIIAQCRPFRVGRLLFITGEEFRFYVERQRVAP